MAVGAEDAAGALELVRKMKVDELKQCLAQVGARRTGIKKQLQERLTDILSSSADAYNRSRAIQAVFTVAASSMSVSVRRAAVAASFRSGAAAAPQASQQSASRPNVRCICEATAQDPVRGALIQCQNQECKIYQHRTCVLVQPGGGQHFLCERCRVQEADPFWVVERVVAAGLPRPVQTSIMDIAEPRTQVLRRFSLSQPECSRLWRDTDTYQLQISCVLMGDAPQERLHWPTQAELAINGARYRPFSRAQNVELSKTSRDLPANVSSMVSPGTNEILLSHRDLRKFYLVARLCRVRPTREVEARIAAPESIADGTQRLIDKARKISDSDDDLVVNQELRLSLIDPMTCARVTRPAYSKQCGAHRVFDLDVFLDAAKRTRKWICPHCLKVTRLQDIVLDSYMARVLDVLENCPSVEEIEVNDAGQWRPVGIEAQGWRSIDNEQRIAPSVVAHAEMMQVESDDDDDKDAKPGPSGGSGARRGVNNKAPPPVIILIDSDDDEPPPAAGTANGNAHAASQPSEQATGASRNGQGGAAPAPATAPASNTGGGARSAAAPQGARTAPPSTAQRPGGPGPPGGAQKNTPPRPNPTPGRMYIRSQTGGPKSPPPPAQRDLGAGSGPVDLGVSTPTQAQRGVARQVGGAAAAPQGANGHARPPGSGRRNGPPGSRPQQGGRGAPVHPMATSGREGHAVLDRHMELSELVPENWDSCFPSYSNPMDMQAWQGQHGMPYNYMFPQGTSSLFGPAYNGMMGVGHPEHQMRMLNPYAPPHVPGNRQQPPPPPHGPPGHGGGAGRGNGGRALFPSQVSGVGRTTPKNPARRM